MAITVSAPNVTRVNDAENATGWGALGASKSQALEPDFFYENANSFSAKMSKGQGGVDYTDGGSDNYTTGPSTWIAKLICNTPGAMSAKGSTGFNARIGSSSSAYHEYYLEGSDTYPASRGWLFVPMDPNLAGFRDLTSGTPSLSAVNYYGIQVNIVPTVKSNNIAMDAIDYVTNGAASLLLVGSSPDGVFQDFIDYDEGGTTTRYGIVTTREGVLYVIGILQIGSSGSLVEFTDANATLVWQDGRYDTGFAGIILDLQNASTVISITNCFFSGRGRAAYENWFDAALSVNGSTEQITFAKGHNLQTGDYILHSRNGGSQNTGLADATNYWVNRVSSTVVTFHTSLAAAKAGTGAVNLTAASAPGENHNITKVYDTRPDFTNVGTSGSSTVSGCTFQDVRQIVLTSAASISDCILLGCTLLSAGASSVSGLSTQSPVLNEDGSLISTTDLDQITGCTFAAGDEGHAIVITSAAGTPFAWDHFHSGYGPNGAEFSTAQAFTSEQLNTDAVHSFTTGDAVFYNKGGGSAAIGLTDLAKYYVNVVDTDTVTMHLTRAAAVAGSSAINLTTNGSETHTLYHSKAVLYNNSGGAIVVNVTTGFDPPTIRNGSGSSTTVNASVPIDIAGLTEGAAIKIVALETVGDITVGDVILQTLADSNGEATVGFNYQGDIDVAVRIRNQGFPNKAIAQDDTVYTEETDEANSATVDDMTLTPVTPVANQDAYYFGHNEEFSQLRLNITQEYQGTSITITWQYWNGAWTALGGVSDGTSNYGNLGDNVVSWTLPGDWIDTTVDGHGPYRFVRALVTAVSGPTQQPLARECKLDVTRYLPFDQNRTIESTGLSVFATWVEDVIAVF